MQDVQPSTKWTSPTTAVTAPPAVRAPVVPTGPPSSHASHGTSTPSATLPSSTPPVGSAPGSVAVPPLWGGTFTYALPVAQTWWVQHPDWFTKPHHDYPAADIPVPAGTPVMAATAGVVTVSDTGGDCGHGVIIAGDDGATYTYCHGSSDLVTAGQRVATGQLIMLSGWSGNVEPAGPAGAHLHFQITIPNVAGTVCPQSALVAWADSATIDVHALPSKGCTDGETAPVVQKILVIGDSLTVGSGPALSADLSATGAAVTVDATVGSGLTNRVVDYRTRIPQDIAALHPDLVVIALGTNDSGAGSAYGADVDAVMNSLPAGQQVIWVLPRRPASLQPGIGQLGRLRLCRCRPLARAPGGRHRRHHVAAPRMGRGRRHPLQPGRLPDARRCRLRLRGDGRATSCRRGRSGPGRRRPGRRPPSGPGICDEPDPADAFRRPRRSGRTPCSSILRIRSSG